MHLGPKLTRSFFERPCVAVARDLIGCVLVHAQPEVVRLVGRIVEVEAYLGDGTDEGSHAHRGMTTRNQTMFGPPGRLYTYRSYGIHTCANVVCEARGVGAAVLLRAVAPLEGVAQMRERRGLEPGRTGREIASGPGRLAQAFALTLEMDGASLVSSALHLRRRSDAQVLEIETGPRVGLTKGAGLPYRFWLADDPWVSAFRPGKSRADGGRSLTPS